MPSSASGSIVDAAVEIGLIEKSGAWFSYNDEKIGQGREAAKVWLEGHPDVMYSLRDEIIKNSQNSGSE